MKSGYKLMREGIQSSPTSLLLLPEKLKNIVRNQFPYDVGLEFECKQDEKMDISLLKKADPSIEISCDYGEVRFRLKGNSLNQPIHLELQLEELKRYFHPNPSSGIHYHIDCTDVDDFLKFTFFVRHNVGEDYILNQLKSWNYTGTFNRWEVSDNKMVAVRLHHQYKTIEFRIGDFSFDYKTIVNKILHCQAIVKDLKTRYRRKKENGKGRK